MQGPCPIGAGDKGAAAAPGTQHHRALVRSCPGLSRHPCQAPGTLAIGLSVTSQERRFLSNVKLHVKDKRQVLNLKGLGFCPDLATH